MKYRALFFDLDGTLMDTSRGIMAATDYIVERFSLHPLTAEEKKRFIGPPIQDSLQRQYGLTKEQAWELAAAWRDAYKDLFLFEAEPYAGIYDVLCFLRQNKIKTGVATNKRQDYTVKLLEHFRFTPLFDHIAGTDLAGKHKKADLIRQCMDKTGVADGTKCLMVGDTAGDWAAAQKAGVGFLGVTYGFGFDSEDAGKALVLAGDCSEIIKQVRE